jgi:sulfoxide reductase heme-binding subunit YedZ
MVGALSLIILSLLAVTSINLIRRKMGQRWQQLHNFIYLIALLVPIHFYWSVKSEIIEPSIYIVLMIGLLYLRRSALKKIAKRLLPQSNKRNQSAEPQVKKA